MADAGALKTVLICEPTTGAPRPPCGTIAGQAHVPAVMNAYVLLPDSKSYIDAVTTPFDYELAGQFWALAFTTVLGLYLVSANAGLILGFLRRG